MHHPAPPRRRAPVSAARYSHAVTIEPSTSSARRSPSGTHTRLQPPRGSALLVALLTLLLPLVGCSSSRATDRSASIAPGQYTAAFDAAREVLRDYKFTLSRIDARAGVIMTEPRFSYGIASPFDPVHLSARDSVRDFMNQQDRRVRITFSRPGDAPAPDLESDQQTSPDPNAPGTAAPPADGLMLDNSRVPVIGEDLRAEGGELIMHVDVVIDRIHHPHRRLETSSIRQSTFAQEPALGERGMQPTYSVPRERDDKLAAKLLADVLDRLGAPESK